MLWCAWLSAAGGLGCDLKKDFGSLPTLRSSPGHVSNSGKVAVPERAGWCPLQKGEDVCPKMAGVPVLLLKIVSASLAMLLLFLGSFFFPQLLILPW